MAYPIPVPPPGPQPDTGSTPYQSLPVTGLASLLQGVLQGAQIGHQWTHEAQELNMRRMALENEAGYRNALLEQRQPYLQARADEQEALTKHLLNPVPRQTPAQQAKTQADTDLARAKATQAQYLAEILKNPNGLQQQPAPGFLSRFFGGATTPATPAAPPAVIQQGASQGQQQPLWMKYNSSKG